VSKNQRTLKVYDERAQQYVERNKDEDMSRYYEAFLELVKGTEILDLGCGPAWAAAHFLSKAYKVTAVDASSAMLVIAKQTAVGATFLQVDFSKPFDLKHSFDGVWASASLLHLEAEDFRRALKDLRRHLRPGALSTSV
jgi:SAM-dependent methyltransferase